MIKYFPIMSSLQQKQQDTDNSRPNQISKTHQTLCIFHRTPNKLVKCSNMFFRERTTITPNVLNMAAMLQNVLRVWCEPGLKRKMYEDFIFSHFVGQTFNILYSIQICFKCHLIIYLIFNFDYFLYFFYIYFNLQGLLRFLTKHLLINECSNLIA